MTWFKVDDKFHSHNKTRKVLAEAPSALALWAVAGSWSSDNLTDGFVPDHQLPWLVPNGAEEMARQLVAARFWKRVRGGYLFHEWSADGDGSKRNPTRVEVEAERQKKAEAGRKGGLARARNANRGDVEEKDSDFERVPKKVIHRLGDSSFSQEANGDGATEQPPTSNNDPSRSQAPATARATAGASTVLDPPSRPDPSFIRGRSPTATNGRASDEPPSRCPKHLEDNDPPPCGPCGDARRAHGRWERDRASHLAGLAGGPRCRTHRGQPAHNCALCRSEQIGDTA